MNRPRGKRPTPKPPSMRRGGSISAASSRSLGRVEATSSGSLTTLRQDFNSVSFPPPIVNETNERVRVSGSGETGSRWPRRVVTGIACIVLVFAFAIACGLKLPEVYHPPIPSPSFSNKPSRPVNPFDSKAANKGISDLEKARLAEIEKPGAITNPAHQSSGVPPDPSIVKAAGTYDLGGGWQVVITPYKGITPSLRVTYNGRNARSLGKGFATACAGGMAAAFRADTSSDIVAVYVGTTGHDVIWCDGVVTRSLILGLSGNDTINGGRGRDIILAGDGVDYVEGHGGDDDVFDEEMTSDRDDSAGEKAVGEPLRKEGS